MNPTRTFTSTLLFILSTATSSHQSTRHRQLKPIPEAEQLILQTKQTLWHRELQLAQEHVKQKRRSRRLGNRNLPSTECMSPLQRWFIQNIESIPASTWESVEQYNITTLAYLYKHYVHNVEHGMDEYFGAYGERTNEMKENHERLTAFWRRDGDVNATDIPQGGDTIASAATAQHHFLTSKQSNVILLGMHGDDLSYPQILIPTLQQIYSLEASDARAIAKEIQSIILQLPGKYTNPLLTSNAIATQSSVGSHRERDSIIIGDGVFTFLEWLDLSSDGPDYIHAHEYSHHIQYDMGEQSRGGGGVGDDGSPSSTKAEQTRRLELMADVFGSYYSAHKNGGGYESTRLYEIHRSAFSLGDCESQHGTHHGTPRQRECASNYGANLALPSYVDGGYKLSPLELRKTFDETYKRLLALDEEICMPVVEESTLNKAIYGEDFERAEVPFYGDDGFEDTDASGGIGDSAPSYLEPVVSWFDPKPANYYDAGQSTAESSTESSSYQQSNVYEPYDSYQSYETEPQGNAEWETEDATVENQLDVPPETLHSQNDQQDEEDEKGDGWFEQTKWYLGRTFTLSSGVDACSPRFGVSIMALLVLMLF